MGLDRNVGGIDRIGRAVLATVLAVSTLGAVLRGRRGLATLTLLASAGLAFNAVTCFCGLNAALGLDTSNEG
ncbi:YgaP family membrane protein [Halomarina oriensis]|uniref:DUF2892 domain-containing protein n=1 Tax=Halomarina oriensis TaxID=671145 RepID=A0A6B0GQK5_9EURY|nr:DUF2892 domain-containing protein [Halomarina oriensis]MWG34405.1 DUF2892 domain-containing protein [Halomarina oriensis]